MIEIEIGTAPADMRLRVPASRDSLPLVRQALRSLGETVAAEQDALEDAELALTEACANAVEHAYADSEGSIEVVVEPRERDMRVSVRDFGGGFDTSKARDDDRGFGLALIESIATDFEVRGGDGTEVAMSFELGSGEVGTVDGAIPGLEPAERILRRVVAVAGAQIDLRTDRLMESLLVAELIARHGLRHLIGDKVNITIDSTEGGLALGIGPLERGGGRAVITESEVPVFGSVVDRLADSVSVREDSAGGVDCEHLVLWIEAASG